MNCLPTQLHIFIGGHRGTSYSQMLTGEQLAYQRFEFGCSDPQTELLTVDNEAWQTFRERLDSLGVDQWELNYPNRSGKRDGAHWSLEISYADGVRSSSGDNNYPGIEAENGSADDPFAEFLSAVSSLIGGREFRA
ncbi:MAG: hypothetical protein VW985_07490 [Gammaproteobacteria bacterium]